MRQICPLCSGAIPSAAPTSEPAMFLLIIAELGLSGVGRWQRPNNSFSVIMKKLETPKLTTESIAKRCDDAS